MIAAVGPQQAQTQVRGHTIWTADAHCGDGKRFVVRSDEKVTAFIELESVIPISSELPRQAGEVFRHPGNPRNPQ
jgi:hypothetical protein